jgi:hypothetical protein
MLLGKLSEWIRQLLVRCLAFDAVTYRASPSLHADDIVVGFQHEDEARRFWEAMRERLRAFLLSLHPDKTRLIEFGRFAARSRGLGKPETFKFLGFVFICGKSLGSLDRFEIARPPSLVETVRWDHRAARSRKIPFLEQSSTSSFHHPPRSRLRHGGVECAT